MAIEITNRDELLDLIEDSGGVKVNHDTWRHGHATQFYVRYNDNDYVTDYIRFQTNEGMEWYGSVKLWPAKKVTVETWVKA